METTEILQPYLPRLTLEWAEKLAAVEDAPATSGAHWQVIDASVVFADISGFTKMSERLARHGRIGAEEMVDTISTRFAHLLEVAYAHGGSLMKFGGDALLLFFEGHDHAVRAAQVGSGIRSRLREVARVDTSAGTVTLRISSGVHTGLFHCFLVGAPDRELIVAGPAWSEVVRMEGAASAGEVMVSPATAAALPEQALGAEREPGWLLRRRVPRLLEPPGTIMTELSDVSLAPYVPRLVRDHLLAGGIDPEHRTVTASFLRWTGTDELIKREGPAAAAVALHELVACAQDAALRNEVTYLGSDIDVDGGKLLFVAGAPRSTGDDEDRMLATARAIVTADLTLETCIGVNRGPAFAAHVGPPRRRTYAVMGDTVNLAARLAARASLGDVLATRGVVDHARETYAIEAMEPFMAKGKRAPVHSVVVGEVRRHRAAHRDTRLPLVGRDEEIATMTRALNSVRAGRGRVIELVGEPGIGKSRLIDELRTRAADLPAFVIHCSPYESATPYAPFWRVLHDLLEASDTDDASAVEARLRAAVEQQCPHLLPLLPLLADPLDIDIADTPETASILAEFRPEQVALVTADLLDHLLPRPVLVVIEDTHWMDQASARILALIIEGLAFRPALACLTRREGDTGYAAPSAGHVETLRPEPLDARAAVTAMVAATSDSPLRDDEIDAIVARSGGNPLFLEELLDLALHGGLTELPDSVDALVTARIDALPPLRRRLLRHAAVLGEQFSLDELAAVLPDGDTADEAAIESLGDFLVFDDDTQVRFRHALVRDAAYGELPFRTRRALHARAGDAMATSLGDHPESEAELLSFHYFAAGRFPEAWRYAHIAGHRAKDKYANAEAAQLLERAVQSAKRLPEPPDDLAGTWSALGDAHERAGRYPDARRAYRRARLIVHGDPVAEAELMLKESWLAERSGRFADAVRWVRRGLRVLDALGGHDAGRVRAELTAWLATVRRFQGHPSEAVELCEEAIALAIEHGAWEAEAQARYILDWAQTDLGRPELAVNSARALEIYRELDQPHGEAIVLNSLGVLAYYEGRWDEAISYYERSRQQSQRTGNVIEAAGSQYNVAEVLAQQGRRAEAREAFIDVLRTWRASGSHSGVALARMQLARLSAAEGDTDAAFELLDKARADLDAIGADVELVEVEVALAECHVLAGDRAAAMAQIDATCKRGEGVGSMSSAVLRRLQGQALAGEGDLPGADAALREALAAAEDLRAPYEVACTHEALADVARRRGDVDAASHHAAQAATLFERLGVDRSVP